MRLRHFSLTTIAIALVFGLPTRASAPPVSTSAGISQAGSEFPAEAATAAIVAIQSAKNDAFATPAFLLSGSERVWPDGFNLRKVDSTGGATAPGPALSRAPVNLDFEDTEVSQTAVWVSRTLHNFNVPPVGSTNTFGQSCELLEEELKGLLIQLGARPSDIHIDERGCPRDERRVLLIDATFSVLSPAEATGKNVAGTLVAHWQSVEFKTESERKEIAPTEFFQFNRDCSYLTYVAQIVLPLFSTRNVNVSSQAVCNKTGVGFRAEALMPAQQSGSSPRQ